MKATRTPAAHRQSPSARAAGRRSGTGAAGSRLGRRGRVPRSPASVGGVLGIAILAVLGSGFVVPTAKADPIPPETSAASTGPAGTAPTSTGHTSTAPTSTPAAAGAASAGAGAILVDQINPVVPRRDADIEVAGRLRIGPATAVGSLSVQLALGARLGSREQLHQTRDRDLALPAVGPSFPVGADGRFTLRMPLSELPLGGPGVYALQVVATGTEGGQRVRVARTTTFLPWVPDPQPPRVPIGWAWPVLDQPRHVPADATLGTELTADGRLDALLAAATAVPQAKVTPVVDPALLDELNLLVQAGAAHPALAANAQRQLARLRAMSENVAPIALPYGNVDVSALVANGRAGDVSAAIHQYGLPRAAKSLGAKPDRALGMPPDGCASPEGLEKLASEGVTAVVLREDCLPVDPALTYTPTARARTLVGGRPLNALVSDPTLSLMAALGPSTPPTPRLAEQDFLAETAMIALEQPAVSRPMVIAPPADWAAPATWLRTLLADTALVPWITPMPLAQILTTPEAARGPTPATVPQLSGAYLSDVDAVRVRLRGLCSMLAEESDKSGCRSETTLLQAESAAWRFRPEDATRFLAGLNQLATDTEQGVRVAASPVVTLTSRSGRVPVTLENNLTYPVTVQLRLQALDRRHIRSATSLVRTLRPGQKVQVEVQVQAQSSGRFPVNLQLFTPAGTPVGAPVRIVVRSTVYGTVALAITIGAVAVLFLAVLVRGIRRIRAHRRGATTSPVRVPPNLTKSWETPPAAEHTTVKPPRERERT